jgi:hypothetical protein
MQVGGDTPEGGSLKTTDLVFPVKEEGRTRVKRFGLAMVCPHYNGTPEEKVPTCETCKFCYTPPVGQQAVVK